MAQFPLKPQIGQSFLPTPSTLYVWNGYQWILGSYNYGAFHDETTQIASAINTATPMLFRNVDLSNGIDVKANSLGALSRISFDCSGKFNIAFSAQLDRVAGSGTVAIKIWLRQNDVDVPWSATHVTMSGNANTAKVVAAWNFLVNVDPSTQPYDNYYELMWSTPDVNIQILSIAANSTQPNVGAYPATPPLILTVNQVGF